MSAFLCGTPLALALAMAGCGGASAPAPNSSNATKGSSSTLASAASFSSPKTEAIYYLDEQAGCFFTSPTFSPDGKLVAVCEGVSGLSIRNARDGAVLQRIEVPGDVHTLRFQDDSKHLFVITDLGAVAWDTATGAPVFSTALHALGGQRHALFSPSGQWFVTADHVGAIRLIDVASNRMTTTMTAPAGSQIERFSAKSDRLVTSSGHVTTGLTYSLWEIPSGKKLAELQDATLSPDLQWAILTDKDTGSVRLVDAATGAQRWKQVWPANGTTEVTWSPDNTRVAFVSSAPGSKDNSLAGQLSVLEIATQKLTPFEFRATLNLPAQPKLNPRWKFLPPAQLYLLIPHP